MATAVEIVENWIRNRYDVTISVGTNPEPRWLRLSVPGIRHAWLALGLSDADLYKVRSRKSTPIVSISYSDPDFYRKLEEAIPKVCNLEHLV